MNRLAAVLVTFALACGSPDARAPRLMTGDALDRYVPQQPNWVVGRWEMIRWTNFSHDRWGQTHVSVADSLPFADSTDVLVLDADGTGSHHGVTFSRWYVRIDAQQNTATLCLEVSGYGGVECSKVWSPEPGRIVITSKPPVSMNDSTVTSYSRERMP